MQLIWISGPTAKLTKFSITSRQIGGADLAAAAVIVLLGALLYFLGIRIAVEMKPDLAHAMGGVVSESEQRRVEAQYEQKLKTFEDRLITLTHQVDQIKQVKDRFSELATPVIFKVKTGDFNNQGGSAEPIQELLAEHESFREDAERDLKVSQDVSQLTQRMLQEWDHEYQRLRALPTGQPLEGRKELTSLYGMRIDPFHRGMAFHSGIDFNAHPGTPILAAGDGVVVKVDHNDSYGNFIEVEHPGHIISKYAHASKVLVTPGQTITRGQILAEVGSTGRSTGPHLHFEVLRNQSFVDPMRVLVSNGHSS
jgi:murein DD-endopeptidase MepM/ murein hydrolase activator NlpD